ncbi:MAG: NADPH-dependent FMN reductase [Planctomycetota bacterium]
MSTTPSHVPRLLAFAGSARRASWNRKLVGVAAEGARRAGAEVTLLDFADYPMPLFNEDLEADQGLPAAAQAFKQQLIAHQGFLIACPEYNSSITALLKNAIDWASRGAPGEAPLLAFRGKVAALMSASPGALGGLRGLVSVRSILGNIGVLALPDQVAVGRVHEAFGLDGRLKDARQQAAVEALGAEAFRVAGQLALRS